MKSLVLSLTFGMLIGLFLAKTVDNIWVASILALPLSFVSIPIQKWILDEQKDKDVNSGRLNK